jgi:hypothetical protein
LRQAAELVECVRRLDCGAARLVARHLQEQTCRLKQRTHSFHPLVGCFSGLFYDVLELLSALGPAQLLQAEGNADQEIPEVMYLLASESTNARHRLTLMRCLIARRGFPSPSDRADRLIRRLTERFYL